MLRLSKLSDYAIVLASRLAGPDAVVGSARELAAETEIPRPTVVKLLKMLTAGDVLRSIRGRNGGYELSRPPSTISLTEVIEAVEGPIAVTECNHENGACGIQEHCRVRRHWVVINGAIRQALTEISLADMAGSTLPVTPLPQALCGAQISGKAPGRQARREVI
jgi:FeS assembly SUF system regulator